MTQQSVQLLLQMLTALGSLVAGASIVFIARQFIIMKRQLLDNRKWNRMSMAFCHLPNSNELNSIEDNLNKSFIKLIDRTDPISNDDVDRLFSENGSEIKLLLKNYLNELESYCAAINMGVVDEDVAIRVYGYKFVRHYLELEPFIERMRTHLNEASLYKELETIAKRWSKEPLLGKKYGED